MPLQPEKKLDDDFEERLFRSREQREAASSAADAPAARSTETVQCAPSTLLSTAAFDVRLQLYVGATLTSRGASVARGHEGSCAGGGVSVQGVSHMKIPLLDGPI